MPNLTATLYQFPLSHYCEKARWALDFKGISYRLSNMAPGLHLWKTKRMGLKSSLPIMEYAGKLTQGSDAIIDRLDQEISKPALTPSDPKQAEETRAWEQRLDREAGVQLRRFVYYYVLSDSALAKRLILHQASPSTRAMFAFAFPAIRAFMRKGMNIRPETVEKSRLRLEKIFEALNERVASHPFLVGEQFSRADLSAAALLAPLCLPPEHPFPWPRLDEMPQAIREFREEHQEAPFFTWTLKMYREHRG